MVSCWFMRSEVWLVQLWTPRQGQPYSVAGTGSLGVQSRTSDTVVRRKGPWPQDTACDSGSPVLAENSKIYGLQTIKILDCTYRKCWKVRWTLLCRLSKKRENFKSQKLLSPALTWFVHNYLNNMSWTQLNCWTEYTETALRVAGGGGANLRQQVLTASNYFSIEWQYRWGKYLQLIVQ